MVFGNDLDLKSHVQVRTETGGGHGFMSPLRFSIKKILQEKSKGVVISYLGQSVLLHLVGEQMSLKESKLD